MDSISTVYFIAILLVAYVVSILYYSIIARKTNYPHKWVVYTPFNFIIFYHALRLSLWNILLTFIPIVGYVYLIVWNVRFVKTFRGNPHILWLLLLPFGQIIVFIYLFIIVSKNEYDISPLGNGSSIIEV